MPKFFAPEAAPGARFLVLTGENAAHARVLRLKAGESVTVCDAKGTDFQCVISDIAPEQVSLVVQSEAPSRAEPGVFCSVYMAFAKAEKLMDEQLNAEPVFGIKDLAVNGLDLIELGMEPGPSIGNVLQTLLEAVVDGDVSNEREALIACVQQLITR